jgi:hypothetical protein
MEFVCRMAHVFKLIFKKPHIVLNFLLLDWITRCIYQIVVAHPMISNSPLFVLNFQEISIIRQRTTPLPDDSQMTPEYQAIRPTWNILSQMLQIMALLKARIVAESLSSRSTCRIHSKIRYWLSDVTLSSQFCNNLLPSIEWSDRCLFLNIKNLPISFISLTNYDFSERKKF